MAQAKDQGAAMAANDPLLTALARLNRALEGLGKAVDQAAANSAQGRDAEEIAYIMAEDRAALARDLDLAKTRADRLAAVNGEVSKRLLGAMETVRDVIDGPAK